MPGETLNITERVHEVVERIAAAHPNKDAAVCAGERISYRELNSRANQLAHMLIAQGVTREEPVGVAFEKSCDLIVAVLGVLKSGAAYVPLGENLPVARLRSIIDDADCRRIVTQRDHLSELWSDSESLITLDQTDAFSQSNPKTHGSPDDLMYILYTSGSTGEPKGVQIEHAGVVRLVQGQDYLPFGPDLNYLFLGPISFDLSTLGMFGPLMSGATMVIDPSLIPDAAQLEKLIKEEDVKASLVIFGLFNSLFEARPEVFETMTDILVGGEAVWSSIVRRAMERLPNVRFVNVYGPTEATVLSTSYRIYEIPSEEIATVPIGKPLAGMTHVVVDSELKQVKQGELGELCMAGIGLARGYLNRPEQNAEKFPTIMLDNGQQQRVYRTGDRVYELPDGNIVFDGRIDEQVKIRGFRIELGAIEASLEQLDGVNRASVVVTGDGDSAMIHARVVGDPIDPERALEEAASLLPEYMVPDSFVRLESLPVTPNGKVDKRQLISQIEDELRERRRAAYSSPETDTERVLCSIWQDLLGIERVGIDESFVELGGHSLRAVVMCSRVRDQLGVELPVSAVFSEQTVRAISEMITDPERMSSSGTGIPVADRSLPVPISFNQQRLWMLDQLNPADPSYNITVNIEFRGDLDKQRLNRAWSALHARHETLRTRITETTQEILAPDVIASVLEWVDARSMSDEEIRADQDGYFREPFDLLRAPLVRMRVYQQSSDRSVLAISMHHIISDAWSCDVLRRELDALYEADETGKAAELPELPIQYADFASWQRGLIEQAGYEKDLAYWAEKFADAEMVHLPTDFPRTEQLGNAGARVTIDLSPEVVSRVRALSASSGETANTVLLAAFNAWLHRLVGSEDIVVGMPLASREHSSLEHLIGFFMETIAVRVGVEGSDSFRALLERTSDEFWSSIDHRNVPFQHLIEALHGHASPGRNPLFEVFYNYITVKIRGGGDSRFVFDEHEVDSKTAKFDLTCYIFDDDESISVVFNYRTDLFTAQTAQRYLEQYITLLASVLDDPDQRVSGASVLGNTEERIWEDLRCSAPIDGLPSESIFEAIDQHAMDSPDAIAIVSDHGVSSYRQLVEQSYAARDQFDRIGVLKGERVVVGLSDPRQMGAAILGVLRAGGVYVPIDLDWPIARIEQVIGIASPAAVMLDDEIAQQLRMQTHSPDVWITGNEHRQSLEVSSSDDAYMLFTSGSTGVPKGVVQTHGGVIEHNSVFAHSLGTTPNDRLLMTSSQGFDAAPMDMYSAWLSGAAWCPFSIQRGSGEELAAFIEEHGITVFHAAPSVLRWFAGTNPEQAKLESVRLVVMGGEQGRSSDARLVRSLFSRCTRMINGFGLTESSVSLQYGFDLESENQTTSVLPIGKATPGTCVRLVDRSGDPTTLYGEIELESARIGSYWNPETRQTETLGQQSSDGRVRFRTGDMARMQSDGLLIHRGRIDHQVQVHGCRIEIGEVQSVLCSLDGVRDGAVVAQRMDDGEHLLHAYVVLDPDSTISIRDLRRSMGASVPGYMVPTAWSSVERIARVGGGKLDLSALRQMGEANCAESDADCTEAMGETAQSIAKIFAEVLGCDAIYGGSDFFQLGGNSFKAIHVFAELRERFGTKLPVSAMFRSPTVQSLANLIDGEHAMEEHGCFIPMKSGEGDREIFLLPGNGGHPLGFGTVLKHIGDRGIFRGVQYPGLDESAMLIKDIKELATHLIERMGVQNDQLAPDLVGYSFGGALALEMALQFQKRGHRPGVVVLLDSHNLSGLPKKSKLGLINEHVLSVMGKGEYNGIEYLRRKRSGSTITAHTPMTKKTGDPAIDEMIRTNRRAVVRYSPNSVYEGRVVLARAQQPAWLRFHRDDGMNGWGRWTRKGMVEVHDIDARHMALMRDESAPAIARLIERALFDDASTR